MTRSEVISCLRSRKKISGELNVLRFDRFFNKVMHRYCLAYGCSNISTRIGTEILEACIKQDINIQYVYDIFTKFDSSLIKTPKARMIYDKIAENLRKNGCFLVEKESSTLEV